MAEKRKLMLTAEEKKMMLHVGARWLADGRPEGWILGSLPQEATVLLEQLVEEQFLVRAAPGGSSFYRLAPDGREWIDSHRAEIRTQT